MRTNIFTTGRRGCPFCGCNTTEKKGIQADQQGMELLEVTVEKQLCTGLELLYIPSGNSYHKGLMMGAPWV